MVLRILIRMSDGLDIFAKAVSLVFLSLITMITIAEVIWRTFFMSITWSEEVSTTFLGTWFIFIGAAVPLKKGQLVSIQFIQSILPQQIAKVVTFAGELMILCFLFVGIKYGFDLVSLTMTQPSPAMMYPMGYAYLGIPIGCCIMFFQTFILLIRRKAASTVSTVT